MNIPPQLMAMYVLIGVAYFAVLWGIDRSLKGTPQIQFRYLAIAVTAGLFFLGLGKLDKAYDDCVNIAKGVVAVVAAGLVFYETHRAGMQKPISERWKRFAGITLGIVSIVLYFNGFRFGYPPYWHRWDQFHYYMGAKYFREMGYDGLYKCTAIAQDELGTVDGVDAENGNHFRLDMSTEVRAPDKKIRNLGGDNLLIPVTEFLQHPEQCEDKFSKERWAAFKADVKFFRITSDKQYWEDMQKDHGYNPPPVWTILGSFFSNLHPAQVWYMQFLASLDLVYLAGMFVLIWWAFGWRVFAVSAVFWGCQSSAPFYWTGGAFLRQDWLFFLVAAAALARKGYFKLAGASMVYTALLRVFPGLAVVGWLVVAGAYLVKHKRMHKTHRDLLIGGVAAALVLVPLSLKVAGGGLNKQAFNESYGSFYKHTLEVHDRTPLTNHMGLRVLISHNVGDTGASGRMKYTKDMKLADPFEVWKRMRNERYDKYKSVAYAIIGASLLLFAFVTRRVKSTWIALCLAQIFIILGSQLTCYYYSFMILCGPLTRVRRGIEAPLFGLAALSQLVWAFFFWYDDRYTVLTAISLIFCYGLLFAFIPKATWERIRSMFRGTDKAEAVEAGK